MKGSFVCILIILTLNLHKADANCCQGPIVNLGPSLDWWNCTRQYGLNPGSGVTDLTTVSIYNSNDGVVTTAVPNIVSARTVGYVYVAGYMEPCYSCGNPSAQIADAINNLINNKVDIDQLWISVFDANDWSTYPSSSITFLYNLVNQSLAIKRNVGIYTDMSHWSSIMNSTTEFNNLDLWYGGTNSDANFDDFKTFGGWTYPTIKQFYGCNNYANNIPSTCKVENSNSGCNNINNWILNYIPH